jgi:serine/threonine protein phosphatase PrpC
MRIDRDLQTEEARLQINTILRTLSAKRAAEAASRAQVQQQQPPRPGYRPRPRYVSQGERDEPLQYDPGDVLRAGCTSVVALVDRNDLWCANAGDSRCVLSRRGKAVAMSFDHKPDDTEERARVERCGGRVQDGRINCGLNLSRALGDFDFKRHLGPKTADGSAGGGGPLASDECVGAFPKAVIVPVNAPAAAAAENIPAAASSSAAAAAGLENASDVPQPGPTGGSTGEQQQQQRQQWERVRLVDQHEQMVTCFPDVEHIRLSEEDEFIVLACDGIWDCLSK